MQPLFSDRRAGLWVRGIAVIAALCMTAAVIDNDGITAGIVRRLMTGEAVAATGRVELEAGRAKFITEDMILEVQDGVIVRMFNRATGTEYIVEPGDSASPKYATGLAYVTASSEGEEGQRLVPEPIPVGSLLGGALTKKNELAVEYVWQTADGSAECAITYSLDMDSGDVLVHQTGEGQREGLSAIRFGLGPVTCNGDLLLPVFHGTKANRTGPFFAWEGTSWQWPTGWPLPLAIFDDPSGGIWIHTQDAERRFKGINYHYEGDGAWRVAFDTINTAPFMTHTSVDSVTWRINTYAGDWTVPVDQFKEWAYGAYRIADKSFARPDWVDDLRLVIKRADHVPDAQIEEYLDELSQHISPSQTLLVLYNWIDAPGAIMPYWKSSDRRNRFNREARERGFRTMYFANYFGMTPNHPRFEEFKPFFLKDPYTGELEGWNLKPDPHLGPLGSIKLYYVNPVYGPWRDFQISEFKALFDAYPADGLFIDQTFNIMNDGNGPIDGMTMVDGNIAFHRELAEALPGVAIGGEGINEVTFQYESVCEFHILSLHVEGRRRGWKIEPDAFDRMVPIMPRFLLPHTRPIGYHVGSAEHPFYTGWRDALRVYHGIPTISHPTIDELRNLESGARRVMRDATSGG